MFIRQFLVVLWLSAIVPSMAVKKKTTTDWNKLNTEELDTEWEEDDDPEELEHEFERVQRIEEERQKKTNFDVNSAKGRKK